MLNRVFRAVMLGAPASGKGTISKRLVEKFGFIHISPGDLLRLNVANGTELGKKAQEYVKSGQLVPDDLMVKFVLGRLREVGNKSWLVDGFPRTVAQAEQLCQAENLDAVLNLDVPYDVIIERVRCRFVHLGSGRVYNVGFNDPKVPGKDDITGEDLIQREDDKPEIVAKRLEVYDEMMKPILKYYEERNLLTTFKGTETNELWPQVKKFIEEKSKIIPADRKR